MGTAYRVHITSQALTYLTTVTCPVRSTRSVVKGSRSQCDAAYDDEVNVRLD